MAAPSVAFYYGSNPPLTTLATYDWAVVEPDALPTPPSDGKTTWFAYVSIGEVHPDRPYAKDIPMAWQAGNNAAWGGAVIDQTPAAWPQFVVDRMITPLWQRGYRAFFLDTLDAFNLIAKTDAQRRAQADGLVRVINAIKAQYPDAKLFANRGFEIMPRVHDQLVGVAFESLFQGWDASQKKYTVVSETDRQWLLGQLAPITSQYKLPVVAIDYAKPAETAAVTQKIKAQGFIPWVADPLLSTLPPAAPLAGLKPIARKVYILYNAKLAPSIMGNEILYLSTPLNYLGLVPRYIDVAGPMPDDIESGQVAGVISWLTAGQSTPAAEQWLTRVLTAHVPWVMLGNPGFDLDSGWQGRLGIQSDNGETTVADARILQQSPLLHSEAPLVPQRVGYWGWHLRAGDPWLTIGAGSRQHVPIAVTPWGGYALDPYMLVELPDFTARWLIDPVAFFQQALQLQPMPVPDVTTENGRRVFLFHIDGDGFVSKAERPGYPISGKVMTDEVLKRRALPVTASVIEGEIGPSGLYPKQSAEFEKEARAMFALPNVEVASHSYSHPFKWGLAEAGVGESYHLDIPGYVFSIQRETKDSIDYINRRLVPPGKKVAVYLWPGDCNPPSDAIAAVRKTGVVAMNGGDTLITRSQNTLTQVDAIGLYKMDELQIFAPNQNENVYTNDWTGPFYGFRRAIETFELTDLPRRYKAIDVYVHFYTASKRASLDALNQTLDWAQQQAITPLYASQYIARATSFFVDAQVARDGDAFVVHGGALRTFRLPQSLGYPDLAQSTGVAGYLDHGSERYVHLIGPDARIALQPGAPTQLSLADANGVTQSGRITPQRLELRLSAEQQNLQFSLRNAQGCTVTADGKSVPASSTDGAVTHYKLNTHAASIIAQCPR
ncbi:bifunctional glycoside hydrolase 114/ polysaccharide deacetylase family protein [Amantichitinum ursilacus]|uniref:bifunctional glycoside hydrolase 114/ polysaccharide deacetylase family protein n=1 Tax=Amantichitinum ursilacus TaxID=857265 RepID=UPI0013792EE3|nr:endo alpha-1,4 polygalactosaminidase [Amantichitinum ursilacus]